MRILSAATLGTPVPAFSEWGPDQWVCSSPACCRSGPCSCWRAAHLVCCEWPVWRPCQAGRNAAAARASKEDHPMFTRSLASLWSRLFPRPAAKRRPPRPTPPHTLPIRTRQELEIAWLLRYLPFQMQKALWADLHALLRRCPPVDNVPAEEYTWPGAPGVYRPRYLSGV